MKRPSRPSAGVFSAIAGAGGLVLVGEAPALALAEETPALGLDGKSQGGSLGSVGRGRRTLKIWIGGNGEAGRVGTGTATSAERVADSAGCRSSYSWRIKNGDDGAGLRGQQRRRHCGGNLRSRYAGGCEGCLRTVGIPVYR